MRLVQILTVLMLAALTGGFGILAQKFGQLPLLVVMLSAVFVAGGVMFQLRLMAANSELLLLRSHLESTRQHTALLARHTRELRENLSSAVGGEGKVGVSEFAALSALVRDIADGLSEVDRRAESAVREIADLRRAVPEFKPIPAPLPAPVAAPPSRAAAPLRPATPAHGQAKPAPGAAAPRRESANPEPSRILRQQVVAAIAADRFDLYLQRVVSLPQRRTRAYDFTLRPDGVALSTPDSEIRASVEAVGHRLSFDRKLMIQAVRLARVFVQRDRDVLLFVDISQRYLMSDAALAELEALLVDFPRAAERLVLCLPQRFFVKAVAYEHEALRKLASLGFTLMLRDVINLELDLAKLSHLNVRWLRMAGKNFLAEIQNGSAVLDVAASDFVALLARSKIAFIAEGVSDEAEIAELIDYGVEFAQGNALAPPQAVRPDVLQGGAAAPAQAVRPDVLQGGAAAPAQVAAAEKRSLRDLARRA